MPWPALSKPWAFLANGIAMTASFVETSGDPVADRRYGYAADLAERGDIDAAIDLLDQTLAVAPDFTSAWFMLGELCARAGQRERAVQAFARAIAQDPGDRRGARLHLMRLRAAPEGALPDEMPPDYVRALFDQFAPRFDEVLVNRLDYRAPDLLRAAVSDVCADLHRAAVFERAIDLGCGTGLGALAFGDMLTSVIGIDVSPAMLARARQTGLYAQLIEADMVAALRGLSNASADVVLGADAVIYLADLAPLCAESARVLAPSGLFAFTVETHDGRGVVLGEKLRYAHGRDYVTDVLAASGLRPLLLRQASARHDGGVAVPGLVIVAGRD